jgi:hypothetical protein
MTVTALLLIALTVLAATLVGWAAYELGAPPMAPPRVQQWSNPPAPPEYLPAHRLETRLRWPGHHLSE